MEKGGSISDREMWVVKISDSFGVASGRIRECVSNSVTHFGESQGTVHLYVCPPEEQSDM